MKIHDWRKVIEYFLEKEYYAYLWDYVTALRSGDNAHDIWKSMITCLIRGEGLNSIAWDISSGKECLRLYDDDAIRFRLVESSKKIPIHYFHHSRKGIIALAFYYRERLGNEEVSDLLLKLSEKVTGGRKEIPDTVRKVINILFEDNSKNGK